MRRSRGFGTNENNRKETDSSLSGDEILRVMFRYPLRERQKYLHTQYNWPRFLYKFRTTENADWLRSLIVDNTLYLNSPRDFNDPFDMRGSLVIKGGIDALIARYRELPGDARILKRAIADARRGVAIEGLQAYVTRTLNPQSEFEGMIKEQGVHCFSSRIARERLSGPRSNLMWSHYADSHKGLCLQYEVARDAVLVSAVKVEYGFGYPEINWLSPEFPNEVLKCVTTKDKCWEYEGEWRYIQGGAAKSLIQVDKYSLAGIIMGSEASKETVELVRQLVAERASKTGAQTKLYKAARSTSEYRLHINLLR